MYIIYNMIIFFNVCNYNVFLLIIELLLKVLLNVFNVGFNKKEEGWIE